MKSNLSLFIWLIFFISSCNSGNTDKQGEMQYLNTDSLRFLSQAIKSFNEGEKICMDSVKKYNLDSLNQRCKSLIYVIFGTDTLTGSYRNQITTIGECNIRLVDFQNISTNLKLLWYNVFVNDSIPVIWLFNTHISQGDIIHGFVVDLKSHKLIESKISERATMKIEDVEDMYNSQLKSDKFKNYVSKYRSQLSKNFVLTK